MGVAREATGAASVGPRFHPWAVGYASCATRVGIGTWSHWTAAIEACAENSRLPLARIVTDDRALNGASGLRELVQFLRSRAHLRQGFIGALIVPTLDHLMLDDPDVPPGWPASSGSQVAVAQLLSLHFGVQVRCALDGHDSAPAPAALAVDLVARRESSLARDDVGAIALSEARSFARVLRGDELENDAVNDPRMLHLRESGFHRPVSALDELSVPVAGPRP